MSTGPDDRIRHYRKHDAALKSFELAIQALTTSRPSKIDLIAAKIWGNMGLRPR